MMKKFNNIEDFLKIKPIKSFKVTTQQKKELEEIIKYFSKKEIYNNIGKVQNLLNANYSFNWVKKINDLKSVKVNSLQWFEILYGEGGKLKHIERKKKSSGSLQSYINKYGEGKGKLKYKTACNNKKGQGKESWYISKYGEVKEKDIKRCKILEEYGYKTLFIEQKEYEDNKINV